MLIVVCCSLNKISLKYANHGWLIVVWYAFEKDQGGGVQLSCVPSPHISSSILLIPPIPSIHFRIFGITTNPFNYGSILGAYSDYCCVTYWYFSAPINWVFTSVSNTAKGGCNVEDGGVWHSDPHLSSFPEGAAGVAAEEAANQLRRAADEGVILNRLILGRAANVPCIL